jgi:hypothetical protein
MVWAMGLASLWCMVARKITTILALRSHSEKRRVHFINAELDKPLNKLTTPLRGVNYPAADLVCGPLPPPPVAKSTSPVQL